MAEVVFSHSTALDVFRWRPDLLRRSRIPLSAEISPAPPPLEDARMLLREIMLQSTEVSSNALSGGLAADPGPICQPRSGRLAGGLCAEQFLPVSTPPIHCMMGEKWTRSSPCGIAAHSGARDFGANAFIRVGDGVYAACPELAFVQCCRGRSLVEAMLLGFEVVGTYATLRTCSANRSGMPPLSTRRKLSLFLERNRGIYGTDKLMEHGLLRFVRDGSASFQETRLAMLLGLPVRMGGRGLGMPTMNFRINASGDASRISGRRFLLADLCWPKARVDVEYESRRHHSDPDERIRDFKRVHALECLGWKVIQVSEVDICSSVTLDAIADAIRKRLELRKRVLSSVQIRKQRTLELSLEIEGRRF